MDGEQLTREQQDYIAAVHRRGDNEVLPGRYQEAADRPELRNDKWASLVPRHGSARKGARP
jgi:hypothetical protein